MKEKTVHCVRVDEAGDEGPSHKEVQFCNTAYFRRNRVHCCIHKA